jgi:hypothetical protein
MRDENQHVTVPAKYSIYLKKGMRNILVEVITYDTTNWAMELRATREATNYIALDSFPAFYGTRRFNSEFTRALHLSLS